MTDIKIANDWKDVVDTYVKIANDWKKTTAQYIKINGVWMNMAQPITGLHAEQYYYEAVPKLVSSLLVLSDIGQLPPVDAKLNGSNAVHLNGTDQSVDLDIVHQLGSEEYQGTMSGAIGTFTSIADGWNAVGVVDANTRMDFSTLNLTPDDKILLTFNAVVNSGELIFLNTYNGSETVDLKSPHTVVNGYNEIEFEGRNNTYVVLNRATSGNSAFDIDFIDVSIKKITTNSSYLTYTDPATQEVETIASQDDGSASSKELVVNGDFSDGLNGWNVTAADQTIDVVSERLRFLTDGTNISVSQAQTLSGQKTYNVLGDIDVVSGLGASVVIMGLQFDYTTLGVTSFSETFIEDGNSAFLVLKRYTGTPATNEIYWDNVSVKQVLPISTTYRMENDFSNCFMTNKAVTQADRDLMKANPNGVINMFLTDTNPLGFSFEKVNIKHYYVASEGVNGGAYVQDLCVAYNRDDTYANLIESGSANTTVTDLTNGNFKIVATITDISDQIRWYSSYNYADILIGGSHIYLRFNAVIHSGTLTFDRDYVNSELSMTPYTVVNGVNIIKVRFRSNVAPSQILLYPQAGGAYEIDFNDSEIYIPPSAEIINYTDSCRTTYLNTNKGMSNLLLTQDGSGRPTAVVPSGQLQGADDGRNIQVGTNIHLIKNCVTIIKGDDPKALIEVGCTTADPPSTRIAFSDGFNNGFK